MICDAVMAVLLKGFVIFLHIKLETTLSLQNLNSAQLNFKVLFIITKTTGGKALVVASLLLETISQLVLNESISLGFGTSFNQNESCIQLNFLQLQV